MIENNKWKLKGQELFCDIILLHDRDIISVLQRTLVAIVDN